MKLFNKAKRLLRDKRGISEMIDVLIGIVAFVAVLVVSIGAYHAVNQYTILNNFATELIQTASDEGKTSDDKIQSRYNELAEATGMNPNVQFSADYWNSGATSVQYGDTIKLVATYDAAVLSVGKYSVPLHLTITKTTKSQRYWK